MSIAKNQCKRSEGVQLGSLLSKICSAAVTYELPMLLATKDERLDYCAHVSKMMREANWPQAPEAKVAQGRDTQKRILKTLNQLSLKPCASLPITRAQAMRLSQLVLFCNRHQDWASSHGPTIGATSAKLAAYLGVNDVTEALAPLLRMGLVALWNPMGNGRRWFHVMNEGRASEITCGSGWTLAPLIIHLEKLEDAVAQENLRLAQRERLVRETRGIIQNLRQGICALPASFRTPWTNKVDCLAETFHNARKGRLARLELVHASADQLAIDFDIHSMSFCPTSREEKPGIGVPQPIPDIYNQDSLQNSCTRHQERYPNRHKCDIRGDQRDQRTGIEPKQDDDPTGLTSACYHPSEAPTLFPNLAGLIDLRRRPDMALNFELGRLCGVPERLIQRSSLHMGHLATSVALMIVASKLDRGEVSRQPAAYLAGMLKKYGTKSLNLGYSIAGMRRLNQQPTAEAARHSH